MLELRGRIPSLFVAALIAACAESGGRQSTTASQVESCMLCHNGSKGTDYAGPGIENPHPFPGAENLTCTVCHGGNPAGEDKATSHVPPPPEIGDREQQRTDRRAYFNKLTLAGMDKFPDYVVDGTTWTALDYLQFVNPGDLRIVTRGRSCGKCHAGHAATVSRSLLATEAGIFSGASYYIGVDNALPGQQGLYEDTAADMAFRAVAGGTTASGDIGAVPELIEYPVYSVRGRSGPNDIQNNPAYDAPNLAASLGPDNRAITGSPLANLVHEQIAFTCGDCHLGSAGANNRYGDFRSSGCTSCHMPYSLDGRSRSRDPNVPKDEPLDPDDIDEPERAHVRAHRIRSTAKTLESGIVVDGIDDHTCAGCHQGSNRTVMQYWGIRLDQNQDLRNRVQYPANPVTWKNTSGDTRLFDPQVRNRTFNGRNANQYILLEDYDGDGRDDTPPDVHYEAGLGCIDCHGSIDLHGDRQGPARIASRMEEGVAVRCESCHGGVEAYAATKPGVAYDGTTAELAVDAKGNVLDHVVKEADGNVYLYGRLTGRKHFVPQTRDVTVDSGRVNPFTQEPLYSAMASFAMGRDDGDLATGTGPGQGGAPTGFRHGDTMNCASCHAAWTNTCMGCHLEGEYDNGNNYSNITGERIVFREDNADFVYQSPVYFQLGVNSKNEIAQVSSNTKMFFRWEDRNNQRSERFAFTDRNGGGADPARGFPSLGHNAMMAHSIRGKVTDTKEGPRYCVACHLTRSGLDQYGTLYDQFRADMAANAFDRLDFQVLKQHFGQNPGNQMNSPLWVHMVAGLGSGLFQFDDQGFPNNPLDTNVNRKGQRDDENRVAPATVWDPARTAFNLDRIVDEEGIPTGSSNHAMLNPGVGPQLRDNAPNPRMAGPLGRDLIRRLTDPATGIVLDLWIDADGNMQSTPPPSPAPQGAAR